MNCLVDLILKCLKWWWIGVFFVYFFVDVVVCFYYDVKKFLYGEEFFDIM